MSQKICGCCNIFNLSKGLSIAELVLSLLGGIFLAVVNPITIISSVLACEFLILEIVGIAKRNSVIMISSCVVRILEVTADIVIIALLGIGIKQTYDRRRDKPYAPIPEKLSILDLRTVWLAVFLIILIYYIFKVYLQIKIAILLKKERQQSQVPDEEEMHALR